MSLSEDPGRRKKTGVILGFMLLVLVIAFPAASSWLYMHPEIMTTTVMVTTTARLTATVTTTLQPMGMGDFTLPIVDNKGLTGQTLTLSSLRGRVVVLEFMEPWCPHCLSMAPIMEALHDQYADKNVIFLEVAGPWRGANPQDVAAYITKFQSGLTYVYDASGDAFSTYGVTGTPTFFILSRDGRIAATYVGETANETLTTAISQQLT
jgi:thiol-disulfide isomerase/thioredoxin